MNLLFLLSLFFLFFFYRVGVRGVCLITVLFPPRWWFEQKSQYMYLGKNGRRAPLCHAMKPSCTKIYHNTSAADNLWSDISPFCSPSAPWEVVLTMLSFYFFFFFFLRGGGELFIHRNQKVDYGQGALKELDDKPNVSITTTLTPHLQAVEWVILMFR